MRAWNSWLGVPPPQGGRDHLRREHTRQLHAFTKGRLNAILEGAA